MRHQRHPRLAVALVAAVAGVTVGVAALLGSAPASANPQPTPGAPAPSNAAQAQKAARAAASHVTDLRGKLKVTARRVAAANRDADTAQAAFAAQVVVQHAAERRMDLANERATTARLQYVRDHRALAGLMTLEYESGGSAGMDAFSSLLTADDPNEVFVAAQTRELVADHQTAVVQRASTSVAAYRKAQRAQASALDAVRQSTADVRLLRDVSQSRLADANRTMVALHRQLVRAKTSQSHADAVLSGYLGGWTIADPKRADKLNAHYLRIAKRMLGKPAAPRSPTWTAAIGRSVAWRALARIGTPYAWAGGTAAGPTTGMCAGGDARHDCHVVGFDCSGLALYGWSPYLSLPHLASSQYTVAGRVHPSPAQLEPGDLVFWSSDGRAAGIHHVAVYVGNGYVVQAPQSGDIVRVTPLGSVDSGYFGATRPLS